MQTAITRAFPVFPRAGVPQRSDETAGDSFLLLSTSATLLTIVLYGPEAWYIRGLTLALAAIAWLALPVMVHRNLWFVLSLLCGAYVWSEHHDADNHKYLLSYWCLALFLAFRSSNAHAALATSARFLIAGCMLLAVLWKLASDDYLSGHFFATELVMDSRFRALTAVVGGMSPEAFEANKAALLQVRAGVVDDATLQIAPPIMALAKWISVVGVTIEAWIAVAFFARPTSVMGRARDLPLILFLLGTYTVATVMGFAYLLSAMGIAQSRTRLTAWTYLGIFGFLQLYTIPWRMFI